MVHLYLQHQAFVAPPVISGDHLDEDSLNAFVEGSLRERESARLTSHLVSCASCRRITSQLIRLEAAVSDAASDARALAQTGGRGRIRRLLEDLAARVIPSSDDESVFAYHAPAEDFAPHDEDRKKDEKAGDAPAHAAEDADENTDAAS